MTYVFQNPSDFILKTYLENAETIAVVGLSNREETAAYKVACYLQEVGYRLLPVNPKLAGQKLLGQTVYASLQDIPVSVDLVNVFRRSDALPSVARDFLETDGQVFWTQLELENQEAEQILRQAGRDHIVMNRCIKLEHQRLLGDRQPDEQL